MFYFYIYIFLIFFFKLIASTKVIFLKKFIFLYLYQILGLTMFQPNRSIIYNQILRLIVLQVNQSLILNQIILYF
jgi:hypothetical protein